MNNRQRKKTILSIATVFFISTIGSILSIGSLPAFSQTKKTECLHPDLSNYKNPSKTKYFNIPELGVAVKEPVDRRVVSVKIKYPKKIYLGTHFALMHPVEYRYYQCTQVNGLEDRFRPYPIYYAIDNPQKLPIDSPTIVKRISDDTDGLINYQKFSKIKINNINFITNVPRDFWLGGTIAVAFVPKNRPDLVVILYTFDEGLEYSEFLDFYVKKFKNISK